MRTIRAGLIALAVAAALALTAGPAAAQYDGETGPLTTSNRTVAPGGTVEVSGSCFAPESEVELAAGGTSAGRATADSSGAIDTSVRIPTSASGTVEITATGRTADDASCVLSTSVSVSGTNTATAVTPQSSTRSSSSPTLPVTGTEVTPGLVLTALGLLAVGGGLVVVARRRRNAA